MKKIELSADSGDDENTRNYQMAIKSYTDAAEKLPFDEEYRTGMWPVSIVQFVYMTLFYYAVYLCAAFGAAFRSSGAPVHVILGLVRLLRIGKENMQFIWKDSALAVTGRDEELDRILALGETLEIKLRNGELAEDHLVKGTWLRDARR